MLIRFLIAFGAFVLLVAALGAVKFLQIKEAMSQDHTPPPTAVTSVEAKAEAWQPRLSAIGTLAAIEGVSISADADGTVEKIAVENGAAVKAGDLLLQLDVKVEAAQLQAAQAQLELARLGSQRSNELRQRDTISQSELDQATAQLNQAEANVAALQATIDKKSIRAPFDGRVGIRTVNLGEYVARGRALIPLQRLNPLFVNFNVPQRQLPDLAVEREIEVVVDAFPEKVFKGKVSAINPEIDPVTRNVAVQAIIDNPGEELRPGMFARIALLLPVGEPVVVLPATAISYAAYGNSVFIIENIKGKDGKEFLGVRQEFVKLGDRRGDQVAILEKVKPGEQVASSGVFKLRNAMPVQVNNTVQPSNNPAPRPPNT